MDLWKLKRILGPSQKLFLTLVLKLPGLVDIRNKPFEPFLHLFMGQFVWVRGCLAPDFVDLGKHPVDRADPLGNRRIHTRRRQIEDHAREQQHQTCHDPKGILSNLFDVSFQIVHGNSPDRIAIVCVCVCLACVCLT